jgi:hypothetical protein
MRIFGLRVYTLRPKEALDFYREEIYPRHLNSLPLFRIEAHGFWTANNSRTFKKFSAQLTGRKRKQ